MRHKQAAGSRIDSSSFFPRPPVFECVPLHLSSIAASEPLNRGRFLKVAGRPPASIHKPVSVTVFFIIYISISKLPLCRVCCIRVARQQHETGQHFKRSPESQPSYINTQRLPAWPQLKRPPLMTAGHQPNNYLQLAALIPTLTQTPHPTGALESSGGATGEGGGRGAWRGGRNQTHLSGQKPRWAQATGA